MCFPLDVEENESKVHVGNDIFQVAHFLNTHHPEKFKIWNLSEESYNYEIFGNNVVECKFPGHPCPPLESLLSICGDMVDWMNLNAENVCVVHCLTGIEII